MVSGRSLETADGTAEASSASAIESGLTARSLDEIGVAPRFGLDCE